jgi:UPF0042 nucleotide-binding protein
MSGPPALIVVSGLSGAGRTTVMKALEDLGFYCADNLPVVLLDRFVELFGEGASRLAVAVDVRERDFLSAFPTIHDELRERGILRELLFLEAEDGALAKRFSETRRSHPAARPGMSLMQGIAEERRTLALIAQRADVVVDTTQMSVHDLKRFVTRRYTQGAESGRMAVELLSFGFRYGVPDAADLMIDVRFLPNPNFEPTLRDRSGMDPNVSAYVLESGRTSLFLRRFFDFLDFLLPHYEEEGKAYLRIAIGCTGGRHRSVAVVGALEQHLRERRIDVRVAHRDVDRERRDDG